jgi:hypothetical protein
LPEKSKGTTPFALTRRSLTLLKNPAGVPIDRRRVGVALMRVGRVKPIPIGAAVTYGNFFKMSSPDTYVIEVLIRQTKGGDPIRARFEHKYYPSRQ